VQSHDTAKRSRRQRRKASSPSQRAASLPWPEDPRRPVFRNRRVRVRVQPRGQVTPYGGLALAHALVQRLELPRAIDRGVPIFKLHLPYHESDHVLTHTYNLFAGGDCIEDIASLQGSEAFQRLVGACRVPDPTTAGDFLRRFTAPHLDLLQKVFDDAHERVWRALPRKHRRVATVDLDSTIKEVYGECKEGADFSYTGKWSYHPLLISLQETNECLRLINRPGNRPSMEGADTALADVLTRLVRSFDQVQVRGDSACYDQKLIRACEAQPQVRFAFVMKSCPSLVALAEALPPEAYRRFVWERPEETARRARVEARRGRRRTRKNRARARGYRTLTTTDQWIAEFRYRPSWAEREYRVIVRRQTVATSQGQQRLFAKLHYRFVITTVEDGSPMDVIRFAYGRCAQENTIEQLKNGIAAMKMPTGELRANAAFLMAGQLAWNLRAWLSLLVLPKESLYWEWKRFRHAFVYVAAEVAARARAVLATISASHRFTAQLLAASVRLDRLVFR